MSKLLQPLMIAVVMTLLGIGYQFLLHQANTKLAKANANAEQLTIALEQQNKSITRLQQQKQQAEALLKKQRLTLQQLATNTKEQQHAVQQHLAKAVSGRPNCHAEQLPAAVVRLLSITGANSKTTGSHITASGANAPLP